METQRCRDGNGRTFAVTDLLQGFRYFITDKGFHYEIEVRGEAGCSRVAVSLRADVINVADELVRLLNDADHVCFTPRASARSPLSLSGQNESPEDAYYTAPQHEGLT
jgi:hypothetical protein